MPGCKQTRAKCFSRQRILCSIAFTTDLTPYYTLNCTAYDVCIYDSKYFGDNPFPYLTIRCLFLLSSDTSLSDYDYWSIINAPTIHGRTREATYYANNKKKTRVFPAEEMCFFAGRSTYDCDYCSSDESGHRDSRCKDCQHKWVEGCYTD